MFQEVAELQNVSNLIQMWQEDVSAQQWIEWILHNDQWFAVNKAQLYECWTHTRMCNVTCYMVIPSLRDSGMGLHVHRERRVDVCCFPPKSFTTGRNSAALGLHYFIREHVNRNSKLLNLGLDICYVFLIPDPNLISEHKQ